MFSLLCSERDKYVEEDGDNGTDKEGNDCWDLRLFGFPKRGEQEEEETKREGGRWGDNDCWIGDDGNENRLGSWESMSSGCKSLLFRGNGNIIPTHTHQIQKKKKQWKKKEKKRKEWGKNFSVD